MRQEPELKIPVSEQFENSEFGKLLGRDSNPFSESPKNGHLQCSIKESVVVNRWRRFCISFFRSWADFFYL